MTISPLYSSVIDISVHEAFCNISIIFASFKIIVALRIPDSLDTPIKTIFAIDSN